MCQLSCCRIRGGRGNLSPSQVITDILTKFGMLKRTRTLAKSLSHVPIVSGDPRTCTGAPEGRKEKQGDKRLITGTASSGEDLAGTVSEALIIYGVRLQDLEPG